MVRPRVFCLEAPDQSLRGERMACADLGRMWVHPGSFGKSMQGKNLSYT